MDRLHITWQANEPPTSAKTWYEWPDVVADPLFAPLETSLNVPHGTLSILGAAFTARLGRSSGWDLSRVKEEAAYIAAAQIYRRGIEYRSGDRQSKTTTHQGAYDISFYSDVAGIVQYCSNLSAAFIVDANVHKHWTSQLAVEKPLILESSELTKTLQTIGLILANEHLRRGKLWVIIAGGLLSDMAAFAATMLGKEFIFVPTTLLATADACVGGKTGVNFPPFGKNQLGRFAFPREVLVTQEWFKTLPEREFLGGLSECLKHAILKGDGSLLKTLATIDKPSALTPKILRDIISFKADVVEEDPTENGKRAVLNYGHTIAHAIEAVSHKRNPENPVQHGEAVALGLFFATNLSVQTKLLPELESLRIKAALLRSRCVPAALKLFEYLDTEDLEDATLWHELMMAMYQDKKGSSDAGISFILLKAFGEVARNPLGAYTVEVSAEEIRKCWVRTIEIL